MTAKRNQRREWQGGAIARVLAGITLAALLYPTISADNAMAQRLLKPKQVRGIYVPPTDPAHIPLHDMLRERRVLERLVEFLSPLRLPRRLIIKFEGCDGEVNAFYSENQISLCYEMLAYLQERAPKETTPSGIQPSDAIIGPGVHIILHELGHAVFDMLKVPVLGREEDAADLFAAYIMLNLAKDDARRLIFGVAYQVRNAALDSLRETPQLEHFADAHGTLAQRYFNLICMAYGSDPVHYKDATTLGGLPANRAEICQPDFVQLAYAFKRLIGPYLSQPLAKRVKAKRWFRFEPSPKIADHTQ